jgi:photosystem II stability/assembly factor-like uncharacterized protein
MKIKFFLIFLFLFVSNLKSQVLVEDTTFSFPQLHFNKINILDSNIAFFGGGVFNPSHSVLYRRNSNGNWKRLPMNGLDSLSYIQGIWAKDTLNITIVMRSKIFYTSNGGESWNLLIESIPGYNFNTLEFSKKNKSTGYVFSSSYITSNNWGHVYKSTDFGLTWFETSSFDVDSNHSGFPIDNTSVTDSLHYYIGLFNSPQILTIPLKMVYTIDGGYTWLNSLFPGQAHSIGEVAFKYDNMTGIVLGAAFSYTNFYKTTNRGNNWSIVHTEPDNAPWGMNWIPDSDIFYVSMNNRFLKSTNNGDNWFSVSNAGPNGSFFSMDFIRKDNRIYGWLLHIVSGTMRVLRVLDSVNTVGIQNVSSIQPEEFNLHQNYPNPFNPETRIKFEVPINSHVKLKVFDMLGREIAIIVDQKISPGSYEYTFNADEYGLTSGIYFYTLLSDEKIIQTKKLILLR